MPAPSRLAPITLSISCLLAASPTSAATTTLPELSVTADSERDKDSPRVREVSTATRTATAVRAVPQAVDTVKTSQVLDYGSNTLGKALEGIPNVSSGADTRFDSVRIRGFEAGNDFYLDGVRDDSQYIRDLHSIERVDVLKGPAAVLYGRGGQGGYRQPHQQGARGRPSFYPGGTGRQRGPAQPVCRPQRRPQRHGQPAPEHGQPGQQQFP